MSGLSCGDGSASQQIKQIIRRMNTTLDGYYLWLGYLTVFTHHAARRAGGARIARGVGDAAAMAAARPTRTVDTSHTAVQWTGSVGTAHGTARMPPDRDTKINRTYSYTVGV